MSCRCTGGVMLVAGALACATCNAPIPTVPTTTSAVYGSRAPYPPIPGHTHRWTRDHAPEMGGRREGGLRGRSVIWIVTHQQWLAWRTRQREHSTATQEIAPVISIDAMIANSGYRATRSAS